MSTVTYMPARLDVTVYHGDPIRVPIPAVTDTAGDPVDLSGWMLDAQVRDETGEVVLDLTVDPVDLPGGVLALTATADESAAVTAGRVYRWDLRPFDETHQALLYGWWVVRSSVSQVVVS